MTARARATVSRCTNAAYIGAYVKNSFFGVTIVAQTSEEIILEPAREVQRKAYYIAGIVISIALFLCFMFSMTLTGPLEKLAEMIEGMFAMAFGRKRS